MTTLPARMTLADLAVTVALLLAALGGLALQATAPPGRRVMVGDGERVVFTAPLDRPRSAEIAGPLGSTRLVIDSDGVRITASPCALKLCMGMGPARRPGDLLACLPNRIVVSIEGEAPPADYDLLSR